jgi:hypothetical protein
MMRTQPSSLLGIVLLATVWFCAHKLVWDCTLIDEDQDSSGQGLLQNAPVKNPPGKIAAPHSPGRWVVYFSLVALPLFGVGQMLLPGDAANARRAGFVFLAFYLAATLGLLVTTSFLGLRRYLRQRYLKMPPAIAVAWLKFGVGVALIVLIGAIFLPRPGSNEAWATLRYQIDYQLRRASDYAAPFNPPGQGQGRPGNDTGGKQGEAPKPGQELAPKPPSGQEKPGEMKIPSPSAPAPIALTGQAGNIYNFLRIALLISAILLIGGWLIRHRRMLLEMARSILAAIARFFKKLFDLTPSRKPARKTEAEPTRARHSSFAEYGNPFYTGKDYAWPPGQIILYSYEAVQVWAKEQGIDLRPEETAREFCARLGGKRPELDSQLQPLARLYAHAAFGTKLPPECDLEPIRELWRRLTITTVRTIDLART